MSQSDQPAPDPRIPTHDDIDRVRQFALKADPWTYSELQQMISFLEGLPSDQLPPPMQAQVEEVLQNLSALIRPLLQQRIAVGLQELATLLQNFSSDSQEEQGRSGTE